MIVRCLEFKETSQVEAGGWGVLEEKKTTWDGWRQTTNKGALGCQQFYKQRRRWVEISQSDKTRQK